MKDKIILCIDTMTARQPELMGLKDENVLNQDWLEVQTSAFDARDLLSDTARAKEIWVLSCDDMEPINLASALKRDNPDVPVALVVPTKTGSIKSRAQAAGLDCVLSPNELLQRYQSCKKQAGVSPDQFRVVHGHEKIDQVIAEHKKPAMVIPVLSASGGSGKSTIAVLMAYLAKQKGYRTLLLDADLQFGDVRYLTGSQESITIDDILVNPTLFSKIEQHETAPTLIGAPRDLERSEIATSEVLAILGHCSQHFDVIVVNTGAFWAEQHVALLERASYALFVLDQRASSLRDCKHALDYYARCAVATQPVRFVLNRCSRSSLFSSIDISCGLEGVKVAELLEGGKNVGELLGSGQPFDLIESKNPLCVSLDQIAQEFLPQKEMGHSGSFFDQDRRPRKRSLFKRKRSVACL